jgi:hypothetical protein
MDVSTDQAALEAIGIARDHAEHTRKIVDELHDMLERSVKPATPKQIVLTQAIPRVTDDAKEYALSIGVFNPTALTIYVGPDGGRATPEARAIAVPPTSLLVLPIAAMSVEIGLSATDAAALAATDAVVVTLLRFPSVQAASLGKGA